MSAQPEPLTDRQVEVLQLVDAYHQHLHEGCPSTYVARQLSITTQSVRQHFAALCRKGWLLTETCPAQPRRSWLESSTYRLAHLTR